MDMLLASVTPTVSLVELIWVLSALIGEITHGLGINDARKDLRALRQEQVNGRLKMRAHGDMVEEISRLVIQGLLLAAGVMAMTRPTAPTSRGSFPIALVLLLAVWLMAGISVYKHRLRNKLRSARQTDAISFDRILLREVDATVKSLVEKADAAAARADEAALHARTIAENLAVAQTAVDGVAVDLDKAHKRADETGSDSHGAAADAAARSPEEKPNEK